jgi:hypothetical protein
MLDVLVIVGNGLTIDLQTRFPDVIGSWDTRLPLSWNVDTPDNPGTPFLSSLPCLQAALANTDSPKGDFERFRSLLLNLKGDAYDNSLCQSEARHFLALAFSAFQNNLQSIDWRQWRWGRWLAEHINRIALGISFNYELVLELALSAYGIPLYRLGPTNELGGLPIFKPHGSIDFELQPGAIKAPLGYPLRNAIDRNDAPIIALRLDELHRPRTQGCIVLPTEYSPYLTFQWVRPYYQHFAASLATIRWCVIIGLSYWDADRLEIDYILERLPAGARVVVANPTPPSELMDFLRHRRLPHEVWPDGVQALPRAPPEQL